MWMKVSLTELRSMEAGCMAYVVAACTRTPTLHVRKTRLAYMHSDPNFACTENTLGLHTLGPQFCTYAEHFVRESKTKMEPGLPRAQPCLAPRGRPIQFAGLGRTRGLCPRFNYFYPKFSALEI